MGFIAIEGIDKEANVRLASGLEQKLREAGKGVRLVNYLESTSIGQRLIELIEAEHQSKSLRTDTQILLHTAAVIEFLEREVWPAAVSEQWVISVGFIDNVIARLGGLNGKSMELIWKVYTKLQTMMYWMEPDVTFILDADPLVDKQMCDQPVREVLLERAGEWTVLEKKYVVLDGTTDNKTILSLAWENLLWVLLSKTDRMVEEDE